jgi:hypothetical protein
MSVILTTIIPHAGAKVSIDCLLECQIGERFVQHFKKFSDLDLVKTATSMAAVCLLLTHRSY